MKHPSQAPEEEGRGNRHEAERAGSELGNGGEAGVPRRGGELPGRILGSDFISRGRGREKLLSTCLWRAEGRGPLHAASLIFIFTATQGGPCARLPFGDEKVEAQRG